MAEPIRKQDDPEFSGRIPAPKTATSPIKSFFNKAGKPLIYAQMLYKTATIPEKIALQCGIHAAFFIPFNNIVGCYLLYDDYKSYKAQKNTKAEPLPFICTQYFNDVALSPLPCKHIVFISQDSQEISTDANLSILHTDTLTPKK
tara:strand:- start:162190 stop:162624 length:435 start_codon:yes stop_codon:yes gene_type:complete